jgi:hypothetical protein
MAQVSWRRAAVALAFFVAGVGVVSISEHVQASCASPQEGGRWWNKNALGDPISLEVTLDQCGDQVLNGVQTETTYGLKVFVKQSSGNLHQRPKVRAIYRNSNGKRWLYAKVPTGGYLDHVWLRPANENGESQLYVYIKHESLDSKPSAESKHWFVRNRPPTPLTGLTGTARVDAVRDTIRRVP